MAYQTGTVNDFVALRTELFNFAQAQGYTLIGGKMLQKGDVYAEFEASTTAWLRMRGGTGEDGSGNPTGAPHNRYAYLMNPAFGINFTWPITYFFHYTASPDELFCFIEYNNGYSQHLLIGEINKAANFTGGGYYSASVGSFSNLNPFQNTPGDLRIRLNRYCASSGSCYELIPFQGGFSTTGGTQFAGSYLHAETGGRTWWETSLGSSGTIFTLMPGSLYELRLRSLNPWNQGMNLVPWYLFGQASSGNLIVLGEIAHLRFCRLRNYNLGDVITIGADQWKLYPVLLKNAAVPDPPDGGSGMSSNYHSGDYGLAVRYDGP
jgi:hypothetical protein